MKTFRSLFAAASIVVFLSACSGGEAENQATANTNEEMPADGNMAGMANDPNNP